MKYNKQDIIQLIEDRILSEYKKHSTSLPDEWAKIAAYKIYKSISDKIEEPKQETLEEASSRLLYSKYPFHPPQDSGYWKDMFLEGAKWQQKRRYSDEEVMNALHSVELKYNKDFTKIYEGMKEWFEQFKKK
jgi:hypothetical protein